MSNEKTNRVNIFKANNNLIEQYLSNKSNTNRNKEPSQQRLVTDTNELLANSGRDLVQRKNNIKQPSTFNDTLSNSIFSI